MEKHKTHLVGVGTEAEMLDSLTGVLGATEEQGVGAGRGAQSKLVEGEGLTTGLLNASTGSSGEAEGGNRQLGDGQETVVISDGADHDHGLALLGVVHVRSDAGERDRGAVDAGHEQATQNSLVEVGLRAAYRGKIARSVTRFLQNFVSFHKLQRRRKFHSFTGVIIRARKR